MPTVLEIIDAHKLFDSNQALDGINFSLMKGEWLALLGPNGAGKTTCVRSVAGRIQLDSGSIILDGVTLTSSSKDSRKLRKNLGIVTQEIALYPFLTASENLQIWGTLHGLTNAKLSEQVNWALDWTGLKDRQSEIIRNYSSGMKRRLNIACSVLHNPKILLLDEPTVGVDPQSRQRIWEMLKGLHENGVSILLTTHQMEEAQQLCERIVIIDHGRVIAQGNFKELVKQTIGTERRLTLSLDKIIPNHLRKTNFDILDESTIRCWVDDISKELPKLLSEISNAGVKIEGLAIEQPSLQEVFIHLTGRELRE